MSEVTLRQAQGDKLALRQSLAAFRETHAIRTHLIAGHEWDVIASGSGEQAIVLLPGGGAGAETQFQLIAAFEPHARVVSIGCPATVRTVREVIDGMRTLLDEYDVTTCYLAGHSLGGIFAQCFATTFPERVAGLIVANTANFSRRRAKLIKAFLISARHWPKRAVAAFLRVRINRLLNGHPDRDFWLFYFTETEMERIGTRGVANRGMSLGDAVDHWSPSVPGAQRYSGPTLILESDNETSFTPAERKAFRALYPHATVHTFHGAGHLSLITRRDEFVKVVLGFVGERSAASA